MDRFVRFGRFDDWIKSNARDQDVVVVRIVMKDGEHPFDPMTYTGDVIVTAKPLKG